MHELALYARLTDYTAHYGAGEGLARHGQNDFKPRVQDVLNG